MEPKMFDELKSDTARATASTPIIMFLVMFLLFVFDLSLNYNFYKVVEYSRYYLNHLYTVEFLISSLFHHFIEVVMSKNNQFND